MYRVAFYIGRFHPSAYTFSPSSDNENFLCVHCTFLARYCEARKEYKYARGTNTLNLKKKIMKNVQSLEYFGVFQSSSSILLCVRYVCQFINSAVILPNAPLCILHQTRESFSCHKIL
jgi:hypothetical protein